MVVGRSSCSPSGVGDTARARRRRKRWRRRAARQPGWRCRPGMSREIAADWQNHHWPLAGPAPHASATRTEPRGRRSCSPTLSPSVADAWIEPRVADVDQQIDEREDHSVEEDQVLDHGPVALGQREYESETQARHSKRALDGNRATEKPAESQARDGDGWQKRVFENVAE